MTSLRVLTALLVLLVLVPAGVLAAMGMSYGARLDEALGRQVRYDLDAAELRLRQRLPALDAEVAALLEAPMEPAVAHLRRAFAEGGDLALPAASDPPVRSWRIAGPEGRTLHPREHAPSGDVADPSTWEERLEGLRRRADRALYGERDPEAALAIWTDAKEDVRAPDLVASLDAEEALLRRRVAAAPGGAAAAWRAFAERWPAATGPDARPERAVLLLLALAAEEDPSTFACPLRDAVVARGDLTPLTDEERRRVRRLAGRCDRGTPGPAPVATAPEPGDVLVLREIGGRARLEVHYAPSDVAAAWQRALDRAEDLGDVEVGVAVPPTAPSPFQRTLRVSGTGGEHDLVLSHRAAAERDADRSRQARWIAFGVVPLFGAVFVGVVLVRRAVRREMDARRLREDFMANVSHELRTPLTSVCLHAEMLAEEEVPPAKRRAFARVVQSEGARLMTLVDDLLDFAALARGQRRLEPEPLDLGEAARRATLPFAALAEQEGVLLRVATSSPAPLARADAHATARVLANLVANAWKHGRPSSDGAPGRIDVEAYDGEAGPAVDVADDGPGIPAEERAHVFERFRRGRGAAKTSGTGLGLALSRELARAMGGDLVLAPSERGTRFRLTLPREPADPAGATA